MDEEEMLGELIPLALSRAHYYERIWGQDSGEFESAALLGAWKAVRNYRDDLGTSLKTYAFQRINGEIIDWMRKELQQKGGSRNEHARRITYCVDFNDLGNRETGSVSEATYIEMNYGEVYEHGYDVIDAEDVVAHLKYRMDERDWDIMYRCICQDETMKSVGESYGISESRICQILPRALERARRILELDT